MSRDCRACGSTTNCTTRGALISSGLPFWRMKSGRKASRCPKAPISEWIHEQHTQGIRIKLVRQSALEAENDLVSDMGIYGSRAVGTQELDGRCRTVRFTLTFDFDTVAAAEERWRRLSVYAVSYRDLLDHFSFEE